MALSAETYLSEIRPTIEGWLYPGAVEASEILLSTQASLAVPGCGVEIGVYKGAYLSFLAAASEGNWYGIDVFLFGQQTEMKSNIDRVLKGVRSNSTVTLRQANSQSLSADAFKALIDNKPIRFASIDGDHSADGVFHDLEIVEANLSPGGIVAMDDVFSPMSASVSEGMFRYLFTAETKLRPVVFTDNKLFLTTQGYEELYQIGLKIALHQHSGKIGKLWRDDQQINRVRPFLNGQLIHL